jgi:leader peptidase (prepilin peptidase)/N-methyltransferase
MTYSLVTAGTVRVVHSSAAVLLSPNALLSPTAARAAVTAVVAVVGLLVGSFLNVAIYRVPHGLSVVHPRSFCPHCDTPIRSVDNIPVVSWLVLRGRCRQCRGPISVRYPLVELGTGIVFAGVAWGLGPHPAVAGFCALAATLVALVAIERDGLAPPLSVALVGTAVATALLLGAGAADRRWPHLIGLAGGVVVAGALVVVANRPDADRGRAPWRSAAPVVLPVGAALGWLGPAYVGEGLAAAAVVVLVAPVVRHRHRSRAGEGVPGVLGLALALGAVVATVTAVAVGAGVAT